MYTKLYTTEDEARIAGLAEKAHENPMTDFEIIVAGFRFMIHWDNQELMYSGIMNFETGWPHKHYIYGSTAEVLTRNIADEIKDAMEIYEDGGKCFKTIKDETPVMMSNWNFDRKSERAMIYDLRARGYDTPDEERVYGSVRTIFLCDDPAYYAQDDRKYARPLILDSGEIVRLEGTELLYRVRPVRPHYEYISDIIHFELVK